MKRSEAYVPAFGTVQHVFSLTCPYCGSTVKVPTGHHVVVPTAGSGSERPGITIDGKSAHRCEGKIASARR